ncbi:Ig-like domain-containing protein [Enterobacillus tribolii]|uniref:Bacterial Ig-like domain-containing protein n=1 Tax=Enterobacillus tribolii TaxID=1487935 RepID=A0A370QT83_9GAMM|nr:Ig-like domain-containing protein [Enterobacillus tribolii]MBW7983768.1 hypothetical protein [Enterobacillus tribolii]RDK92133.1 hypothetical protein C8D90_104291 [Enterobacillus tribolii]
MGKKIVLAVNGAAGKVQLLTADADKAVRVKLVQGNKYLLKGVDDNFAPENVVLKRAGSELHVIQQGDARPSIIIEDYFNGSAVPPSLTGMGADGQIYAYAPLTGSAAYETGYLGADGDSTAVFLGGTPLGSGSDATLSSGSEASTSSSGVGYTMFGILGGLGAIAGIAIAASDSDDDDSSISHNEGNSDAGGNGNSSEAVSSTPPEQPAIGDVQDNTGAQTGTLANGDVTDEARPVFSGQSEAGNTLTIYDNGNALGSVVADQDGNWTFTPDNALSDGEHAFTVIARDASGNASDPSDPITITIDTAAAEPQPDDVGAPGALSELLVAGDDTLAAFFPEDDGNTPDYAVEGNTTGQEYGAQEAQYGLAPAATLADMHAGLADLLQSDPTVM